MKAKKNLLTVLFVCGVVILMILLGCYTSVSFNASGRTYDNVDEIPAYEYGLILGTSPFTAQGARNFYFENRIKSAVELIPTLILFKNGTPVWHSVGVQQAGTLENIISENL